MLVETLKISEVKGKELELAQFFLKTDYNQKFLEMIRSGRYFSVDDEIREENFPFNPELLHRKEEGTFQLISIENNYSSKRILDNIAKNDSKPGNIFQLFSLGRDHPKIQIKHPIVALDSCWRDYKGCVVVPFLGMFKGQRAVRLACFHGGWTPNFKFLVAKK